jgi:glycosyltransferase involved in cell wall biosynthesis
MKVLYRADFETNSGYARAARAHAKALIETSAGKGEVLFERHTMRGENVPLDEWWREELDARSTPQSTPIKIWHETPEFYSPSPAQINVAMLAWETDRIPNIDVPDARHNWVKQLNKMDLVWTFAESSKEAFVRSGVTVPIQVIPHPLDPHLFTPPAKAEQPLLGPDRRPLRSETFKFLSVFQWIPRKDPMRLLLAYLTEFTPDEDTVLVIRAHLAEADVDEIARHVAKVRQGVLLPHPHPRVLLVPGILTDAEMGELYRSVDCYVTASKGEGFGLPAHEALASGVPVIAPKHSAFLDHLNEDVGYFVDSRPEPVAGQPWAKWYHGTQTWNAIDVMDLRRRMREAYDDRVGLADRAKAAPGAVRALSPTHIGETMWKALQGLMAGASRKGPRPAAPVVPRVKLT